MREISFEPKQWKALSDVFEDIGQILFATLAIPFFGIDDYRPILALLGGGLALMMWWLKIILVKKS